MHHVDGGFKVPEGGLHNGGRRVAVKFQAAEQLLAVHAGHHEIEQDGPNWLKPKVKSNKVLRNTFNVLGKMHEHLWGKDYKNALEAAKERMDAIEVDRTRVKPVVKITGEFWAQITEGDGNFHMFDFLEREGAQVIVEPIATWVAYLMYQAKAHAIAKWPVNRPHRNPKWHEVKKHFANYIGLRKKLWGIGVGQKMWNFFYHRTADHSRKRRVFTTRDCQGMTTGITSCMVVTAGASPPR